MLTCGDVIQCLEDLFPTGFAESWDNVGLLIGRREKPVYSVMLCVDVTERVIQQAIQAGVSMIVAITRLFYPARSVLQMMIISEAGCLN